MSARTNPFVPKLVVVAVDPDNPDRVVQLTGDPRLEATGPANSAALHHMREMQLAIDAIERYVHALAALTEVRDWRIACLCADELIDCAKAMRDARVRLQLAMTAKTVRS